MGSKRAMLSNGLGRLIDREIGKAKGLWICLQALLPWPVTLPANTIFQCLHSISNTTVKFSPALSSVEINRLLRIRFGPLGISAPRQDFPRSPTFRQQI